MNRLVFLDMEQTMMARVKGSIDPDVAETVQVPTLLNTWTPDAELVGDRIITSDLPKELDAAVALIREVDRVHSVAIAQLAKRAVAAEDDSIKLRMMISSSTRTLLLSTIISGFVCGLLAVAMAAMVLY